VAVASHATWRDGRRGAADARGRHGARSHGEVLSVAENRGNLDVTSQLEIPVGRDFGLPSIARQTARQKRQLASGSGSGGGSWEG